MPRKVWKRPARHIIFRSGGDQFFLAVSQRICNHCNSDGN
jgi:hypothetical protein